MLMTLGVPRRYCPDNSDLEGLRDYYFTSGTSRMRESNSRYNVGNVTYYHCTNTAGGAPRLTLTITARNLFSLYENAPAPQAGFDPATFALTERYSTN